MDERPDKGWQVHLRDSPYNDDVEVFLYRKNPWDGSVAVAESVTVRRYAAGEPLSDRATFGGSDGMGKQFIRGMLNAAWDMGMRPDGYQDQRETTGAVKAHLEDMRKLAFSGQETLIKQAEVRMQLNLQQKAPKP